MHFPGNNWKLFQGRALFQGEKCARRSTRWSLTLRSTRAISTSWFTRSKKFLQIYIHDPPLAGGDMLACLLHGLMRASTGAEAVAGV